MDALEDRHWLHYEFPELAPPTAVAAAGADKGMQPRVLLEAGCGVGNTVFPLLEADANLVAYACDFSPRAVSFVQNSPHFNSARCTAFQCDLTAMLLSEVIPVETVDLVTLLFVLSAISPLKMHIAVSNLFAVMRPGGILFFRDYALFDHAMLRFKPGHKITENFYARQDGTRAYYFSVDFASALFTAAGFTIIALDNVDRATVNIKEGLSVPRLFLQGRFQKPF